MCPLQNSPISIGNATVANTVTLVTSEAWDYIQRLLRMIFEVIRRQRPRIDPTYLRYVEHSLKRAVTNGKTATITTTTLVISEVWDYIKCLLPALLKTIFRGLKSGLQWTGRHLWAAIVALWQASGVERLLRFIGLTIVSILKWVGIALASVIGLVIVMNLVIWGLPKLLTIRERRREEQRLRLAAILAKERQEQAAEAARVERERARQAREAAAARAEKDRRRRARELQAAKERQQREEEQRKQRAQAEFQTWEAEFERTVEKVTTIRKLPIPPLARCTIPGCDAFAKSSPVPVCQHNVRQFFQDSGRPLEELLKRQTTLWHPDRFRSCRKELRREFERLANTMFVILRPWYEEVRERTA